MELTTIIGMVGVFAFVINGIMNGGEIGNFIDMPSVYITIGGMLMSTIASFPMDRLMGILKSFGIAFKTQKINYNDDIDMVIGIANTARREGLLALENSIDDKADPFLKKGIMLIVDGSDPELVKTMMETELDFTASRHSEAAAALDQMAEYGPAYGMIGTLVGLINMLKNMSDMGSLGSSMATALVTTFYGCMIANGICKPIAKKIRTMSTKEIVRKELIMEGLLSIQDGENPRIIREKLNSFMSRSLVRGEQKQERADAPAE